jgi:hypothetical protein
MVITITLSSLMMRRICFDQGFRLFCVNTLPAIDLVVLLDLPSSRAFDAVEATLEDVERLVPA